MPNSVFTSQRHRDDAYSDIVPAGYTSNALRLFVEDIGRRPDSQVLDIGPVCGENISFFAQWMKKVYICDMFIRLDRDRRKGLPVSRIWRHLDYPPESFDGIVMWDLCDHLDDREVDRLVKLCHIMVKPGGIVILSAPGKQEVDLVQPAVNCFVIQDGFRLLSRRQPHLDLPVYNRPNRDVLAMLVPFDPAKSFTARSGLREFLFRRKRF